MKMDDIRSMFFFVVVWQTFFAIGMGATSSFKGVVIPGPEPEVVYGWWAFLYVAGMSTAGGAWLMSAVAALVWLFSKR